MTSSIDCSRIARSPRAPVLRLMASLAIAVRAVGSNSSETPSYSKSLLYCLVSAFFGRVRMSISAASSSSSSVAMTGRRPMNSGMRPKRVKSSGSTCAMRLETVSSVLEVMLAASPMLRLPLRMETILSRPTNAPPQMNRMFEVSTCTNSCWGCLRPPLGGTLEMVPSMILRSACWTPSPLTSRVIEGFSLLREILSTSSM